MPDGGYEPAVIKLLDNAYFRREPRMARIVDPALRNESTRLAFPVDPDILHRDYTMNELQEPSPRIES